jgi:hypothetical protein
MSHTGSVLRAISGLVALSAALATAAPGAERHPQHDLVASSHSRSVQATLGSHCTPTADGMLCADHSYPLRTKERLPIHAGGRIVLRFRARPTEIDAQLRDRRSRSVYELRTRGSGMKRTIRLPRELPVGTDRLGVFVGYERGSADFEVDLKRHRH